jgi:hypothetical protein
MLSLGPTRKKKKKKNVKECVLWNERVSGGKKFFLKKKKTILFVYNPESFNLFRIVSSPFVL